MLTRFVVCAGIPQLWGLSPNLEAAPEGQDPLSTSQPVTSSTMRRPWVEAAAKLVAAKVGGAGTVGPTCGLCLALNASCSENYFAWSFLSLNSWSVAISLCCGCVVA